jgi:hypothetical protein
MTRKHAITALTILAGAVPATVGLTRSGAAAEAPAAPVITFADAPTAEQREMADWAVERYLSVGLQLPDVEISYPVTCDGKAGRYLVGKGKVELCRPTRKLVLHELAHAWDDAGDTVDREAFMELRGVDHWYENADCEYTHVSGGEQLALAMTWGLMDIDITAPASEYAGQPIDERPRYLPGMEDSAPETLTELFVLLTGSDPLSPGRVVDTPR